MKNRARPPQYLFPDGAEFVKDNLVLHARAKRHVVKEFPGPLSIKSVISGLVPWVVDGRPLVVDTHSFLVLNDGQRYSMDMELRRPAETCCVFFQRGFVEQIAQDATTPVQSSLDAPTRRAPSLHFLSRIHRDTSRSMLPRLWSLAARCSAELQPSSFEEDFLILSEKLVLLYKEITEQISRVPGIRAATREELFRRLQRAREYIHSSTGEAISLEDVAKEACLSRYHLHRAFTRVFQQTPHAYLTALRLERAQTLLKRGRSVTETCIEVGFSSMSSFSRLFRGHHGLTPSSVRKSATAP
jgi:AraC family transcriptional regulator